MFHSIIFDIHHHTVPVILNWYSKYSTGSFKRLGVFKFSLRAVKMHQIKFSTSAFFSPFRDILSGGIKIDFSLKID